MTTPSFLPPTVQTSFFSSLFYLFPQSDIKSQASLISSSSLVPRTINCQLFLILSPSLSSIPPCPFSLPPTNPLQTLSRRLFHYLSLHRLYPQVSCVTCYFLNGSQEHWFGNTTDLN